LATALTALKSFHRNTNRALIWTISGGFLGAGSEPETVALHLAQAKCRLFPDLDRPTIYREYGIGGDGRE
jgi:hypothetical protein